MTSNPLPEKWPITDMFRTIFNACTICWHNYLTSFFVGICKASGICDQHTMAKLAPSKHSGKPFYDHFINVIAFFFIMPFVPIFTGLEASIVGSVMAKTLLMSPAKKWKVFFFLFPWCQTSINISMLPASGA